MHPLGYVKSSMFARAWWESYRGSVCLFAGLILYRVAIVPSWGVGGVRASLAEALTFSCAFLGGALAAWGESREDRREASDLAFHLGGGSGRMFMPPFAMPSLVMLAGFVWSGESFGLRVMGNSGIEPHPWNSTWVAGVSGAVSLILIDRWVLRRVSLGGHVPRLPRRAVTRWIPLVGLASFPPIVALGFTPSPESLRNAFVGFGSLYMFTGLIVLWVWARRVGSDGLPTAKV